MPISSVDSQRISRQLYLEQRTAALTEAKKRATAAGTTASPQGIETVQVVSNRRTFDEIDESVKAEELAFAKSAFRNAAKGTGANLLGLPFDILNLVNVESRTGLADATVGSSDWFKDLFGVDDGSFGETLADVNPGVAAGAGTKLALAAAPKIAGLAKAGLFVPLAFWKNKEEADQAVQVAESIAEGAGMWQMGLTDQWKEINRSIFERTNGWFYDFNGNLRKHVPTEAGGLNPASLKNGRVNLPEGANLESALHPDVWANFDEDSAKFLKNIPIRLLEEPGTLGTFAAQYGIGVNLQRLRDNPVYVLEVIEHELEHGFAALIGSGRGGGVRTGSMYAAAELKKFAAQEQMLASLRKKGYREDAINNVIMNAVQAATKLEIHGVQDFSKDENMLALRRYLKEPEVEAFFKATREERKEYNEAFKLYMRISGEAMARMAEVARDNGFPFDKMDVPLSEISLMRGKAPVPLNQLAQSTPKRGGGVIGKVLSLLDAQFSVKDPRQIEEAIQKGDLDNELARLVSEQHGEALRDKTRFKNPELNAELDRAREAIGVDPAAVNRARRQGERINEAFPSATWFGEGVRETMTVRDTQGARADDVRGGAPSRYEGFGNLLEGAERMAVGKEEVWRAGKFDIEAYRAKLERVSRARMLEASKGSVSQRTGAISSAPKFWAFDPETNKIAQVTAKQGGGFEIRYKTGKITDSTMEKVDIIATRKGLNEFISRVLWKRATGEPITYLDPSQ